MQKIEGNGPVSLNIVRIMEQNGQKQCAVAKRAGYSKQVFCNMVNDYRVMRPDDIIRVAKALGVAPEELFKPGG